MKLYQFILDELINNRMNLCKLDILGKGYVINVCLKFLHPTQSSRVII